MHTKHLHLFQATLLACLLAFSLPAKAGGLGWYYSSFSWNGLTSYFGGGDERQKGLFLQHLNEIRESEKTSPIFHTKLTDRNFNLWKSFIDKGIPYRALSKENSRFADEVIATIMSEDAKLEALAVKSETDPDFIHSGAFQNLLQHADKKTSLLGTFRFGRSFGQQDARKSCLGIGRSWRCMDTYVILSPAEGDALAKEIRSIVASKRFKESQYEELTYVTPLLAALEKASKAQRGMYIRAMD